ncbi:hypothetical protein EJ05DRAFT_289283 [Pseudovirgaria hyperparasitica]|uniref:Uncharacterized protein n=1 Tax=Pseudovirgaria hyperparasitica TaxID=470096 RepID=A0A6A6WFA7_9PEZI|nr:uncharacterized protein EJ05DRAFT_289283 [Pseudovirgaria hyperparasitica]KAF2760566.1 hypothetical protein EJ05DRAFT_289283 [Pseudovirgaria hyperparasitica]
MPSYDYSHDRLRDPYTTRPRDYDSSHYYNPRHYENIPRSSPYNDPSYLSSASSAYNRSERRRWPPSPSVDDESDALAKEFGNASLTDPRDDVPARGTPDQNPIIEDVDPPSFVPENKEDRFVIVGRGSNDDEQDTPTRERRRSRFNRMPALNTDIEEANLYSRREPSPYAFSRDSDKPSKREPGDFYLSPKPMTPSYSSTPRLAPPEDRKPRPKSQRSSAMTSDANSTFEDSDVELDEELLKNTRRPARYSFAPSSSDHAREDIRASLQDLKKEATSKQSNVRFSDTPGSGTSSQASTPPPNQRAQKIHTQQTSASSKNNSPRNSYPDSDSHLRPATAVPSSAQLKEPSYPPSPPRSPWEKEQPTFPRSSSKPTSRPVSPIHNNSVPSPPRTRDADRYPSTYSSGDSRVRPEPRVSSSLRHDTLPPPSPVIKVQATTPARKSKLPYPDDDHGSDGVYIPTVEAPIQRQRLPELDVNKAQSWKKSSSRPSSPTRHSPKNATTRPILTHRYTDSTGSGTDSPTSKHRHKDSYGSESDSESRRKTERVLQMKSCPRPGWTTHHDDWVAIQGYSKFAICRDCYKNHIAGTIFDHDDEIKRPRYRPGVKLRCSFDSAWVRMAFTLTKWRRERDLGLIKDLAEIAEKESECPKNEKIPGVWYGLKHEGKFVPDLFICPYDIHQLEALFSTLKGMFTIIPQPRERSPHRCTLGRPSSPEFTSYLDVLHAIDEKAVAETKHQGYCMPNMKPLVALFPSTPERQLTTSVSQPPPPCTRGFFITNAKWHYIPRLPEFTVCSECYTKHIKPYIAEGYLADRFLAKPTYLPRSLDANGVSCQMYPKSMQKLWADSDEYNDYDTLAAKARERKREEDRYRARISTLERRMDRATKKAAEEGLDGRGRDRNASGGLLEQQRMMQYEMDRLAADWRKYE